MRKIALFSFIAMVSTLVATTAHADLVIKITQGVNQPTPVAVVPFAWNGEGPAPVDVAGVVAGDLARSGLFVPLADSKMLAYPNADSKINFINWKAVSVNDLVVGSIAVTGKTAQIEFRLFNVYTGQQLLGYSLPARVDDLRFAAHQVADKVYEKLTGTPGAFATRIAYIRHDNTGKNSMWELIVADSDGANAQVVVKSSQLLMSPAFSFAGSKIAYVEFENNESHIYIQNIATGKRRLVLARPGLNSAPAFSPDGKELAVVLSTRPGNPDIYILNPATGKLRQITHSPAIDTEPAWMPDGKSLIFTSDRGGSPQLYELALNGDGKARRITWNGSYNARAAVSPDGKSVALVHRENGALKIALLNLASGNLRLLSNGPTDVSPSFAPNGAMILYSTGSGKQRKLATVSVDGRVREELSGSAGALSQPTWGKIPGAED
jgi:TolB protein